jgi:hypothetical protein
MPLTSADEPSKLRALIRQSFRDVKPPARDDIAVKHDWDYEAIVTELGAHTQDSVPREVLEEHAKSLAALTPRAFCYYLPAYMSFSVEEIESEVTDILLSELHSATNPQYKRWKEYLEQLGPAHRKAICKYVKYVIPRRALGLDNDIFDDLVQFWCLSS